ncbi:hypothetical protein MKW98_011469 [Papaver atlanticum]|uniref:Cytochrome P450 n=1 Tax=Papaver atlanticum TaxID=357466 RepID=A0AAD4RX20_9MAGN|nr:hypothetical protein MKW98_011469 [Papaver atlanticum]
MVIKNSISSNVILLLDLLTSTLTKIFSGYTNLLLHILVSTLLVFSINFGIHALRKRSSLSASAPLPPGPVSWPVVGCLPKLLLNKPASRWILSLMKEMNTEIACIRLGNVNVISVTSPELAREFFRKQDAVFASRPITMGTKYMTRGFLTAALVASGDQWKKMRRVLTSELISPTVLKWLLRKRNEEANYLVCYLYNQCMKNSVNGGGVVDLRLVTRQYAANVIRKMVFNKRYFGEGSKDGGAGLEEVEHVDSIFTVLSLYFSFSMSDFLPCLRWFDFEGHEKLMNKTMRAIDKYHDPIIEERIQRWRDRKDEIMMQKKEPEDLLDVLISLEVNGKPLLSTEEIKGQITELFYASIDNPSNMVEWAVAEMINQPDVLRKAVKEIDMVVGKDRLVQESDFPKLNYVKACAREAFRLHPISSFNVPHISTSDTTVGGYFIPKDSYVLVSRYGLGRNPRVWDEPSKFKPERHFKTHEDGSLTKVELTEPDLTFISFGIGRRGCPGIQLGSAMSIMLLARLLQAFDWVAPPDGQSMVDLSESVDDHLMLKPLLAHAKPRLPLHVYAAAEI